jgi:predicted enzyme related to lactoylglutathione lyase
MTTHDGGWPAGTPCWVDTMANDLERSQAFYRAVLGWDFSGGGEEFGGYTNASVNGRLVAGVMPTHPSMAEAPKAWTVYLATDDAAATAAAVEEAGGRIISPVTQVGDLGAMAICNDNTGMPFGLWQAGTHGGFGTFDEPGSAAWLDLMTPSFVGAQEFTQPSSATPISRWGWRVRTTRCSPCPVASGLRAASAAPRRRWARAGRWPSRSRPSMTPSRQSKRLVAR